MVAKSQYLIKPIISMQVECVKNNAMRNEPFLRIWVREN